MPDPARPADDPHSLVGKALLPDPARLTAVQVNFKPSRQLTDRERELLAREMLRAASARLSEWDLEDAMVAALQEENDG